MCGFILVVKTHTGTQAVRVPEWDYARGGGGFPIRQWDFPEPYIEAVVSLGGGGRSQFVVTHWHGKSTLFMRLYGVLDGKLVLLTFHGDAAFANNVRNEIAVGGTAFAHTAVQCVRGGPLTLLNLWVASYGKGKPTVMALTRSTFRLDRKGFSLTKTQTTNGTEASINALAERAGFNNRPFSGCIVAHRPTA